MLQCSIFAAAEKMELPMPRQPAISLAFLKLGKLDSKGRLAAATRVIQKTLSSALRDLEIAPTPKLPKFSLPLWPDMASNDAGIKRPASAQQDQTPPRGADDSFGSGTFSFEGHAYPYRLYIPSRSPASPTRGKGAMPIIVLLHGCTQNAQDFACGTSMNDLAERHGFMVLYPEQIQLGNAQRCWNWFEPGHQQSGRGEPGMIAALTRKVLLAHTGSEGADPKRVYIAGLSAGGAMAAVVAGLYPDLFAAVGVHSGLASGSAQDMMSAFGAMRRGAPGQAAAALPTIVFHGNADQTVHPDNGDYISDAALEALYASGLNLVKTEATIGVEQGQSTERTIYSDGDGITYVEHWRVDDGAHAWSGGNAAGSFTDPDGPSASAAMVEFFLQHKKP